MATRYFPFHRLAKIAAFACLAIAVVPSCAMEPSPTQGAPRTSLEPVGHQPKARKKSTPQAPPRRPPASFAELQAVAGEVAGATGRKIGWRL